MSWLVVGGGGWWLVVGGWWLVVGGTRRAHALHFSVHEPWMYTLITQLKHVRNLYVVG